MIKFEKVKEYKDVEDFIMPYRATASSAGYDIFNNTGKDIIIKPHEALTIPTGLKAKMPDDMVLKIFPRSGHGFKYGIRLANTCGIIDCVPAGTLIQTVDGEIPVEELMKKRIPVYSYNEEKEKIEEDDINDIWIVEDLELIEIETENNKVIVPKNKQVYTKRGWIKAKDLSCEDVILTF